MAAADPSPCGHDIHGQDGVFMAAPDWLAVWLETSTNVSSRRVALRGLNPAADDALVALHSVATQWSVMASGSAAGADSGTEQHLLPEPERELVAEHINVNTAAEVIGISARAVRKAIADQRLPASRIGSQWLIDRTRH